MAEVLLRARLDAAGVAAEVGSAGLLYDGREASAGARAAMAGRGLDLEGHRSRTIDGPLVAAADLVIAMEPRHVREAVAGHDAAWSRAFTLRELLRRAAAAGPRRAEEELADWLGRVGADRRRIELLADDDELSVLDPYRQSQAVYDDTAAELDALLARLVALAWPTPDRVLTASHAHFDELHTAKPALRETGKRTANLRFRGNET